MVWQGELAKELRLQEELCLDPSLTQGWQAWETGATLEAASWAANMGRGLVPLWELQQAVLSPVLLRRWPCGVTSSNSGKSTGVSGSKIPDKPQTEKKPKTTHCCCVI